VQATLKAAASALQSGQLAEAQAACRSVLAADPSNAQALQLLGLVQQRLGRVVEAEALFRRAIELVPRNPQLRANLALLLADRGLLEQSLAELERALVFEPRFRPARLALARVSNQAGRHDAAAAHARKLIAADDNDGEAWSALGAAVFGIGRISEARAAFERAVSLAPRYGAAKYNLAAALCAEERAEEALAQVEQAARLGVAHRGVALTRARALMQLDRYDEAEASLTGLLATTAHDVEAQYLLAQLRHVRGDSDFARSLREAAALPDAPPSLCGAYADVMCRAGEATQAEQLLRKLVSRYGPLPELQNSLGTVLMECGRYSDAVAVATMAAAALPDNIAVAENLVAALLSAGDPARALPIVERFRALTPHDQRWITYRTDIARLRGEDLFEEWCNREDLVLVYDLSPPAGYATIEDFHAQLRPLLESRHKQAAHPLDQSMRYGTQTSRGLLGDTGHAMRTFFDMLAGPIADYQAKIGASAGHPLLARNRTPARLTGCWSVRLSRGGFHVNHIHPQGWISSAYYVSVPAEVDDVTSRSGWLKFCEPRFPVPGAQPVRFVQPRSGRLALFPSYMWHGTVPIQGDEPRLTIAFDAIPGTTRQ
jgi:uncharacterized protein (TIGR02466 family)